MLLSDKKLDALEQDFRKQKDFANYANFVEYESWKTDRALANSRQQNYSKNISRLKKIFFKKRR